MSLGSALGVSEKGARRRRADYLVLVTLEMQGKAPIEDLDEAVNRVATRIAEESEWTPMYFKSGGSNGSYSRELNEALDRCLHLAWVEQTNDGRYRITEKGRDYLGDDTRLRDYGVDESFRDRVDRTLRNRC